MIMFVHFCWLGNRSAGKNYQIGEVNGLFIDSKSKWRNWRKIAHFGGKSNQINRCRKGTGENNQQGRSDIVIIQKR